MGAATGYPDFQSFPNQVAPSIVNGGIVCAPGFTQINLGLVGSFPSLFVAIATPSSGVTAAVQFADSAGFGGLVALPLWKMPPSTIVQASVPVLKQYGRIQINNRTGGSLTVQVTVCPLNMALAVPEYTVSNPIIFQNTISVGAGITIAQPLQFIYSGTIRSFVSYVTGTAWTYQIQALDDLNANVGFLQFLSGQSGQFAQEIEVPAAAYTLFLTNGDVAARSVNYTLALISNR